MDPAVGRLTGADILIRDGKIAAVGRRIRAPGARTLSGRGKVCLPGLVNTHHHLYQTFFRAAPQVHNAKLFDWLTVLYDRWKNITPEDVYTSALVGLGELLLTGCTTTTDHFYVFPKKAPKDLLDSEIEAGRRIGIRFHPCRGSMSLGRSAGGLPPDEVVQTEEEILKDCERLADRYHDPRPGAMCRIALAPCSPFSVTPELLRETSAFARKRNLRCHTHLAETLDEEEFCLSRHGKRPVGFLEELGWLGPQVWFAHCVHLSPQEISLLGRTKTGVAHCPTSNLRLGSGVAPLRALRQAGAPVGLAVDGSSSNDSSDMLAELRMCLLVHRKDGAEKMTVEEVLETATTGGAAVLGRDDIGRIAPGYCADLAIWDLNRIGFAGSHDPVAALLFCGDSHIADTVIVNGEVVVREGRLTRVDEEALIRKANRLSRRLMK